MLKLQILFLIADKFFAFFVEVVFVVYGVDN